CRAGKNRIVDLESFRPQKRYGQPATCSKLQGVLLPLARPCRLPWTHAPTLAGHLCGGYPFPPERRHPRPLSPPPTPPPPPPPPPAAGLRRAAPARRPALGRRAAPPDPPGDGAGPRGLPAPARQRPGAPLEQPRPLLRRGRRGHAPHPRGRRSIQKGRAARRKP